MLPLDRVSAADFTPHLHSRFRLTAEKLSFELELVEVNDTGRKSAPESRSSFSLLFKAAPDQRLPQQMYRIEHDKLDAMDLFIVPVRADQKGYYYEAIFN
jgi:hypothetical protein